MDDDIRIRHAVPADIEILVDLRELMLVELGLADAALLDLLRRNSLDWMAEALPAGVAAGWIAERAGAAVGGVSMTLSRSQPQFRSPNGRTAHIYGLYVASDARGQGVATALIRGAIEHAKAWGAEIVTLHAADKARPLYQRLGFEATKEMRLQFTDAGNEMTRG